MRKAIRKTTNPESMSEYLRQAIRAESKARKLHIIKHAIRRAYESDVVLLGLLRKILPDMKSIDVSSQGNSPYRLILDFTGTDTGTPPTKQVPSTVIDTDKDINSPDI